MSARISPIKTVFDRSKSLRALFCNTYTVVPAAVRTLIGLIAASIISKLICTTGGPMKGEEGRTQAT